MLNKIEIVDYKCFKNFSLDGFERVNLIGGKNNIGKTVFLEAILVNTVSRSELEMAAILSFVEFKRQKANLLAYSILGGVDIFKILPTYLEKFGIIDIKSNLNKCSFELIEEESLKKFVFQIGKKKTIVNVKDFLLDPYITKPQIRFLDTFGISDEKLSLLFEYIQKSEKESYLNEKIRQFDGTVEGFKVIGGKPQCKKEGNYYNLSAFGDGLKHYISIICALYACENGQLFIDEIDNGIHYTQLEAIWKIIFEVSKEVNCQVFATTHSKECIEAFNRADTECDGGYFEFYRNQKKGNAITASKRDREQLDYALAHNGRIRGE